MKTRAKKPLNYASLHNNGKKVELQFSRKLLEEKLEKECEENKILQQKLEEELEKNKKLEHTCRMLQIELGKNNKLFDHLCEENNKLREQQNELLLLYMKNIM